MQTHEKYQFRALQSACVGIKPSQAVFKQARFYSGALHRRYAPNAPSLTLRCLGAACLCHPTQLRMAPVSKARCVFFAYIIMTTAQTVAVLIRGMVDDGRSHCSEWRSRCLFQWWVSPASARVGGGKQRSLQEWQHGLHKLDFASGCEAHCV